MLVPELAARPLGSRRVIDLDAAHSPLDQPAREQALAAEDPGLRLVESIELPRLGALALDVEGRRGLGLHAIGKLEAGDARVETAVLLARLLVHAVQPLHEVELAALARGRDAVVPEIGDRM